MPKPTAELDSRVQHTTQRIADRSRPSRELYLQRLEDASRDGPARGQLSCTNIAHAVAASPARDKLVLHAERQPNLAIVSSYNDMLSAHQPFESYPEMIRSAAREAGATAQFAGGTPAMCDGVTQGQPGMELSLFSRDTIALSTAVALSHNMFDAALYLGVCDKIIPGLLMGALTFGHLPALFVPAGPMTTGLPNKEKARTRQRFAAGKATREELLQSESASYHGPGTCTFYGTANSNQMLMEIMGLHLPGAAFINPGTDLRDALTRHAPQHLLTLTRQNNYQPVGRIIDEKAICNAIVGLLATGGSTNHTIHLIAIARAAGIVIDWDDFDELAAVVPLLTHVYPSGQADINQFHAAGGMSLVIRELLDAGLLHDDVNTVVGTGLHNYTQEPWLDGENLRWREGTATSLDAGIIATHQKPFSDHGGLKLVTGNLGRAMVKSSAVKPEHLQIEAPAAVFHSQDQLQQAFNDGELERDFIAIIMFQGPRSNGMPELHKLTPVLGVLLDRGFKVALVTDGRMSGASGKVPAAIHVSPECSLGGELAKVHDGDMIRLDCEQGILEALVDQEEWAQRTPASIDLDHNQFGMGRELFAGFRQMVGTAETGAVSLYSQ
ncbi:MAG: phosphogluconate dehydratase [Gammaproteobacteria bacterium]|nr:phosphogluconate dehydratase [Gammaproteobacteria bacterium]